MKWENYLSSLKVCRAVLLGYSGGYDFNYEEGFYARDGSCEDGYFYAFSAAIRANIFSFLFLRISSADSFSP